MNKARRTELNIFITNLENIAALLENTKSAEEDAKDNLADYPQFDDKVCDMEIAIDSMDEAVISIQDSIDSLKEAVSS